MQATVNTVDADTSCSLFLMDLIRFSAVSFKPGRTSQKRSVFAVHNTITYQRKKKLPQSMSQRATMDRIVVIGQCASQLFSSESIYICTSRQIWYPHKTVSKLSMLSSLVIFVRVLDCGSFGDVLSPFHLDMEFSYFFLFWRRKANLVQIVFPLEVLDISSDLLYVLPLVAPWHYVVRAVRLVGGNEVWVVHRGTRPQFLHVRSQLHLQTRISKLFTMFEKVVDQNKKDAEGKKEVSSAGIADAVVSQTKSHFREWYECKKKKKKRKRVFEPEDCNPELWPSPWRLPDSTKKCPIRQRWCRQAAPWAGHCGRESTRPSRLLLYPNTSYSPVWWTRTNWTPENEWNF